jgi:endonuclease/exonuclease/phosphatase family metal-dependent hydrolase
VQLVTAALLLVLASSAACIGQRPPPRSVRPEIAQPNTGAARAGQVRIATYNVHMQSGPALARAIRARPELLDVDVWLLQEIEHLGRRGESEAARLARELGMGHVYAPAYGLRGGGSHGVAILSRIPFEDVEIVELPYFNVRLNAGRRIALGATILAGETPIRVYSVHLDNRLRPDQRIEQLAPLVHAVDERALVVGGDFNTSPFSWRGHLLPVPRGRRQADRLEGFMGGHGFDAPTRDSGPTSAWLRMRLDALFTRDAEVLAAGVDRDIMVSDHFPVWIDLAAPGVAVDVDVARGDQYQEKDSASAPLEARSNSPKNGSSP